MIEVGEYVRTNGIIGKVEQIGNSLFWLEDGSSYSLSNKSIKHSKNIIDLIEVGDYVNGYPVRRIANFNNELCNFDLNAMEWTPLKDIDVYYNILTKEQYMQNCYTVERKEEWNIDI